MDQPFWLTDSADVKQCCADLYASDWARLLIGESLHPGGLALTDHLADLLGLTAEDYVIDIASGRGASAFHLAERFGCRVFGIDYSAENVATANQRASDTGLAGRVRFIEGDAEMVAVDEPADVVICECSLSTFPDKVRACRQFRRLLRPGGRLGISDVTREQQLPSELSGAVSQLACIADACSLDDYTTLLVDAGFTIDCVEPHNEAAAAMIAGIRQKLALAPLLARIARIDLSGVHLDGAREIAAVAAGCVDAGQLGYAVIVAHWSDLSGSR